jgi:hypothetical protein
MENHIAMILEDTDSRFKIYLSQHLNAMHKTGSLSSITLRITSTVSGLWWPEGAKGRNGARGSTLQRINRHDEKISLNLQVKSYEHGSM